MKIHLSRIQKVNPVLNALVQMTEPEKCLMQAREIDQKIAKKLPAGKLSGLPIAIKDVLKVKT
jgi:Asp-tRNA(Asn)/Glu-tRNA(Gln) amidotransferase A subunit family amidase